MNKVRKIQLLLDSRWAITSDVSINEKEQTLNFHFFDYTYLSHVHLTIAENNGDVFVLATYGGIAAL